MRALIIEDDPATAQSMELLLKSEGFNAYATDLGEEGVDLAKTYDYDIIMLEACDMPDMNGLDVLRQIRAAQVKTPVVIVSGRSDIETKVKAFGAGADDYLTKPFHKDELIARLKAVVLRSKGHADAVITTGPITLNLTSKEVTVDDKPVYLTGKEYQMLELLSLRKGNTVSKEMFLNHLYGGLDEPEAKIVDVFLCKLRCKLGEGSRHIETIWGHGYRLSDAPTRPHTTAAKREVTVNEQVERTLAKASPDSMTSRAIVGATGIPLNSINSALNRLRRDGRILKLGSSSKGFAYRLAEAPAQQPQTTAA